MENIFQNHFISKILSRIKFINVFIIVIISYVINSCETAPEVIVDLTPTVELLGSWDTNELAPTNNVKDFKVILKVVAVSINILKDDSFCIDNNGSKITIVSDITAERVYHAGVVTINLEIPSIFSDESAETLTNCQLSWKFISDPDDELNIIKLGDFNFDTINPILEVVAPVDALSPAEIADTSNTFVKLIAVNKDLTIINSTNSCIDLQAFGNDDLIQGEEVNIPISLGNIKPNKDGSPGIQNCAIIAEDGAGNLVIEEYEISVRLSIFDASLDKDPPNYTYDDSIITGGRAELTVVPESAGRIHCRTSTGINCLATPLDVDGNSPASMVLDSMLIGTDNYIVSFTPEGQIFGNGWDTVVSINDVTYEASIVFNVIIDDSQSENQFSDENIFHNPVNLIASSNFAGTINIVPRRSTDECPPYPEVTIEANTTIDISNIENGTYIGNYPVGTLNDSVDDIKIDCRVTIRITKPTSLAGTSVNTRIAYTLDRQPPLIEFINGGLENIPIQDSLNYAVEFDVSEPVIVESNSCDDFGVGNTLYPGTALLQYNHSKLTDQSSGMCSLTLIDQVQDELPIHRTVKEYSYVIEKAQLIYRQPFSFIGNVGNGIFESSANGTVLCWGPINATDGTLPSDCFRSPQQISARSSVATTKEILMYLQVGTYEYQFTLIPFPPYNYNELNDETEALHRTVITETITATDNPLQFTFVNYNSNTYLGIDIPWVEQTFFADTPGSIEPQASPGSVCPIFTPSVMELDGSNNATFEVNVTDSSRFPSGTNTTINCTLVFTTNETPNRTAELLIEKVVDKTTPTLRYVSETELNIEIVPNFVADFITNEPVNLVSSSNCGSGRLDNVGTNSIQLDILNTTTPTVENDTIRQFFCKFIAIDDVGNRSTEIEVVFDILKPTLIIYPDNSAQGDIDFVTIVPNVTLQVSASSDGVVECSIRGRSVGSTDVTSGARKRLILTDLLPGTNEYVCTFNQDGIIGFPADQTITIKFDNDTTLTILQQPNNLITDPNIIIEVLSSRNGTLTTETPPGGLCFTINSPTSLLANNNYLLDITLPPDCGSGNICNINCDLLFTETETGSNNNVYSNVNFTLDREGIKLASTPYIPTSEILSYDNVDYEINFDQNISINPNAGHIEFRDYYNNGIIFRLNNSNVDKDGKTLRLTINSISHENILDHRRFYISIPENYVLPENSTLNGFPGTCNGCLYSKNWNYYTSVDISNISSRWTFTPNSGNVSQTPTLNLSISCSSSTSNRKYCLDESPDDNIISQVEQTDYKNNFPIDIQNDNQSFVINTIANANDSSSSFRLELTTSEEFNETAAETNYNLVYNYIASTGESYETNRMSRLYTQKGVIVVNNAIGSNQEIWSFRYLFNGLIHKITDPDKPALVAYGLRRLNFDNSNDKAITIGTLPSNYDFDIKLSSSDANTEDVGFTIDGDLNTSIIIDYMRDNPNKFIIVYKWYDQTGNNYHLEQIQVRNYSGIRYSKFPIIGYTTGNNDVLIEDEDGNPSILFANTRFNNNFDSTYRNELNERYKSPILGNNNFQVNRLHSSSPTMSSATVFMVLTPAQRANNYTLGFSNYNNSRWSFSASENRYPRFEVGRSVSTNYYQGFSLNGQTFKDKLRQFTLTVGRDQVYLHYGETEATCQTNCSASLDWSRVNASNSAYFNVGGPHDRTLSGRVTGQYGRSDDLTNKLIISEIIIFKNALNATERALIVESQQDYYYSTTQ